MKDRGEKASPQSKLDILMPTLDDLSPWTIPNWLSEYSHAVKTYGPDSIFTLVAETAAKKGIPAALNTLSRMGFATRQKLASGDLEEILSRKKFKPKTREIITALWEEARAETFA